jgi:hypothetical protein
MAALLLFGGAYFLYDGYKGYPKHNQELAALKRQLGEAEAAGQQERVASLNVKLASMHKEYSDHEIGLQKKLGFALPPIGIALLIWTFYRSRGQIRLTGQTLHAPGHPPVTFTEISDVDSKLWDRKGIALLNYKTAGGKQGTIRLDDFVYERKAIDAIYDRLRAFRGTSEPATET